MLWGQQFRLSGYDFLPCRSYRNHQLPWCLARGGIPLSLVLSVFY